MRDDSPPLPLLDEKTPARPRFGQIARVLFPLPLPEAFDYAIPDGLTLAPGTFVQAPLGKKTLLGVVWSLGLEGGERLAKLKSVVDAVDAPLLPDAVLKFVDWAAKYLCEPPGEILSMILRCPDALQPSPVDHLVAEVPDLIWPEKLSPQRAQVLKAARALTEPVPMAELARRAEVSDGVVQGLVQADLLRRLAVAQDQPFARPDPDHPRSALSDQQAAAADYLQSVVAAKRFAPVLVDGVTGSGKTEVYFEAIAETLRQDPTAQILVLLPEIALTQAVLGRFEGRFGASPVEWHSNLTPKVRRRGYREVLAGRAQIVVGARSALFLPYQNLRLIIVDEEHDSSYKQEEGVRYHARDLAVARARFSDAVVLLASATPSLETYVNAQSGRYKTVQLPARHGVAVMPDIELVDMRKFPPERGSWLSPALVAEAKKALDRDEQVLFYLNRRGYAPLTLCRTCGHRIKAPDTDTWLVEHRQSGRLVCHLTGFSMKKPKQCPECQTPDSLTSIGPGVERIAEEAQKLFPQKRVEIFSSDMVDGADAVRALVERMVTGEIDVLVGTQIVAKGHNFPNLTFVGVVDADAGLKGGDLRAGERTFQVLSQVTGRAGRATKKGLALIQTYAPEHEALRAIARGDRDAFLEITQRERNEMGLPPFGRLAALILSAPNEQMVQAAAEAVAGCAPNTEGVDIWGPAVPPFGVVRGRSRRRFLIRAERQVDLSAFMGAWRLRMKLPSAVKCDLDIEPYSFL